MPAVIVVGAQWGDEGKGKVIDILAARAKHIIRAQGGNNAGHTVLIGNEEYKLHLIPSGILHDKTQCYIGAGTVIDPEVLAAEIQGLELRGVQVKGRLHISPAAHVILPYHRLLDAVLEKKKGNRLVGTTGKGIGPCYVDKANRLGIRMGEFVSLEVFAKTLKSVLPIKNEELTKLYGMDPLDYHELYKVYSQVAEQLEQFVSPVERNIHRALEAGSPILLEGAQGTFLDITVGTYPFATSSNTTAGGICAGAGIGPTSISHTLGVIKAYTTRVGNGPLPTEVGEDEQFLDHTRAREFGTTTGRKRRIGWFDAVLAKTAVRLNGLNSFALMKLDVLDPLDQIKICTGYTINEAPLDYFPFLAEDLEKVRPVYEVLPGWKTSTSGAATIEDLPPQARGFLERIEALCGIPVSMVSTGPEREQTIITKDLLAQGSQAV